MKKINFRNLSTILSEKELKNVIGGSNWLPEVEITCGSWESQRGPCWSCPPGHIPEFTGNPAHYCNG